MYAVYTYAAGSSTTNVVNDLVKLITGETNKANLSAACVQSNTNITSTVAAGWTVHDASAGTDFQVLKSLNADGTTYKYYGIRFTNSTVWTAGVAEGWNSSTHTGTNLVGISNTYNYQSPWDGTNGGVFYIYVTPRNIFIRSFCGAAWQIPWTGWCGEFTRDAVPTGYPCHFLSLWNSNYHMTNGGHRFVVPRTKFSNGGGDYVPNSTGITSHMLAPATGMSMDTSANKIYYRDGSENVSVVAHKLEMRMWNADFPSTLGTYRVGEIYDILCVPPGLGGNLDEITISGKTHIFFTSGSSYEPHLLVPKE